MEQLKNNMMSNSKIDKIYGLRYDQSFKRIFSDKENFQRLMKDIFHEELEEFTYVNKEMSKENRNNKCGVIDMITRTSKRIVLMEVQNKSLKTFKIRFKNYTSLLYTSQPESYQEMLPVEAYAILNYEEGNSKVLKEFSELERRIEEEFDNLSRIKVWNIKEALKEEGMDREYAKLFSLDQYGKEEAIKILLKLGRKKRFEKIVKEIMMYNLDSETYLKLKEEELMNNAYEMEMAFLKQATEKKISFLRQEAEIKRNEAMADGIRLGREEGISIGEELGENRGISIGEIKTARSLFQAGVSLEVIMKATGLTEEQIKKDNILD